MSNLYHHPTWDELLESQPYQTLMPGLPEGFIPPGYNNPSYVPPYRGNIIVIITVVSTALIYPFVILRMSTRRKSIGIKMDDWLTLAALVLITGMVMILIISVYVCGLGYHAYDLNLAHLQPMYTLVMVYFVCWIATMGVIRCSVLYLIRRIFGEASLPMQRISTAGIILTILYTIGQIVIFVYQCNKPRASFDLTALRHASCKRALLHLKILKGVSIGIDTFILFLPVYSIWTLRLPLAQRMRLICLFWLGVVAWITGVLRYISYEHIFTTYDIGYDIAPSLIWSQIESATAIMVSSILSLYNHFSAIFNGWWSQRCKSSMKNSTGKNDSNIDLPNSARAAEDPIVVGFVDEEAVRSEHEKFPKMIVDVKLLSSPATELRQGGTLCSSNVGSAHRLGSAYDDSTLWSNFHSDHTKIDQIGVLDDIIRPRSH